MKVSWPLVALTIMTTSAVAQSVPNGNVSQGQVWTPAQWNAAWTSKLDVTNGAVTGLKAIGGGSTSALATASPVPTLNIQHAISGAFGSGNPALNQILVTSDTARQDSAGDANSALFLNYNWGGTSGSPAGTGGRYALKAYASVGTLIKDGSASFPFIVGAEVKCQVNGNLGGTSMSSIWGGQYCMNPVATLAPGATWVGQNADAEYDVVAYYGSSAYQQWFINFVRLGLDWGTIGNGDALGGRMGITIGGAQPVGDPTSPASALASYGQHLPDFFHIIDIGSGEWIGGPTTSLIGTRFQVPANSNSCADCGAGATGSPPHGGAAIAAPIIKPMVLGHGVDLHNVTFSSDAWFTPGFQVRGNGQLELGTTKFAPTNTTTGLTIDQTGSYVSAIAVGAFASQKKIGEQVFDNYGGIYQVTSVDGSLNVNGLSIVQPGYVPGATPCSAGCAVNGSGSPMLVNYTWSKPTKISINPTGADVILPAGFEASAGGGVHISSFNLSMDSADIVLSTASRNLFFTDLLGGHPSLGMASNNMVWNYTDNTGATHPAMSYLNGQSTLQPLFVQVPLKLPSFTVAALNAAYPCNSTLQYAMAAVSDAATPTYNGALTGGSNVFAIAFCNGTAWTAH